MHQLPATKDGMVKRMRPSLPTPVTFLALADHNINYNKHPQGYAESGKKTN